LRWNEGGSGGALRRSAVDTDREAQPSWRGRTT